MRSLTKMLAAGMLCLCLVGQDWTRAQSPELSSSASVSFRAAATTAIPGFKMMSSPEGRFYVGPKVLFTGSAVNSIRIQSSGERVQSADLATNITVSPSVSQQVAEIMQTSAVNRLAILVGGSMNGAPIIQTAMQDGHIVLSGLSHAFAMHLMNVVAHTGVASGATSVSLVPSSPGVKPEGIITVDMYIAGVAGLRGYQMQVVATGARTGRLPLADIRIDTQRPDYVFGSAQVVNAADASQHRIASILFSGTVDVGKRMYLGTYSFQAPEMSDTYYVNVVPGGESFLRTEDGQGIPFQIVGTAVVSSGTPTRQPGTKPSLRD